MAPGITQAGNPRGQLRGTKHFDKGTKFSFFKSYNVDDTAFILLSRGEELITASKLIVTHFPRFGLTISHWSGEEQKRRFENRGFALSKAWTEIIADMEGIEID
jgi:hypothetical protein